MNEIPIPVASHLDLSMMKVIAINDEKQNSFKILGEEYWEGTKSFFGAFVKAA
jgi:hypothetical protein